MGDLSVRRGCRVSSFVWRGVHASHRFRRPRSSTRVPHNSLGYAFLSHIPRALAQEVGASLTGSVVDPNGLGIGEASITATNQATGIKVSTTTNVTGDYVLPSLTPGTYSLTAEKPGFKTTVLNDITLVVFQRARMNVPLEIGEVATHVEVKATAPLVDSTTATVAGTVENRKMVELPLNLRRFSQLATLFPGAVQDNGGFASSSIGSPFSEATYSANGMRTASNNYLVDGIDMKSYTFGGVSLSPSVDSIQEFKVQTTVFSAAFGRMAGSTINLVTKSGTNELHGSLFEFARNNKLDANNFFNNRNGIDNPQYQRHQFGGAAGGRYRRTKHSGLRVMKDSRSERDSRPAAPFLRRPC